MVRFEAFGGEVKLYKRSSSKKWQCAASVGGKQRRASTNEISLEVAKDWYLTLMGKDRAGILVTENTFADGAKQLVIIPSEQVEKACIRVGFQAGLVNAIY